MRNKEYKRQQLYKELEGLIDEIIAKAIADKILGNTDVSNITDIKVKQCSDEDTLDEIISQCEEKNVSAAIITMNLDDLINVICANMEKVKRSDKGYYIRPEFGKGMMLELREDKDVRPGDVIIRILDTEDEDSDEKYNLLDYLCDDEEGHLEVEMSVQTLDMLMGILKGRGQEPLMFGGKVLIPCSGYKLVVIDNEIPFGKISYPARG